MKCKKIFLLIAMCSVSAFAAADDKSTTDCVFLAEMTDANHKDEFSLQYCMYTQTETRGIFAATACVGVLIESQSGTRHAFYGSKGHWGIEGKCEAKKILDKFNDPETLKTMNPITDIKSKRKSGNEIKIIKDDYKIGDTFLNVTSPK